MGTDSGPALTAPAWDGKQISVWDLELEQLERIERDIGLAMNRWQAAPSLPGLARKILAQYHGIDEDAFLHLTMRDLRQRVELNPDTADPDR